MNASLPRKADADNNLTLCARCGQPVRGHDDLACCPICSHDRGHCHEHDGDCEEVHGDE